MSTKYELRISGCYCLLFTAYCLLSFSSCENDLQTINLLNTGKGAPSETMKDAEIIYSDSGIVKMKLTGPQLERYSGENPHIIFPRGVHMLFYDDSMKVNSTLKAEYGIRYEAEGGMEAKRNVEVVNVKGDKLNTEHLIWEEGKDRIYTKEFVKITQGRDVIYGDGLESNQDFTKYKILKPKGVFTLNDQDSTGIQE
ncbi:MAG: LPS export ABC transporter periplasmic protein LptC [Bacteroidetes bacterium]|nr:MAG: LPS export ABC transporter periplasmic protein LptC [Bacteroidota bacterium]